MGALDRRDSLGNDLSESLYARLSLSMGYGYWTGNSDYWQGWRDATGAYAELLTDGVSAWNWEAYIRAIDFLRTLRP